MVVRPDESRAARAHIARIREEFLQNSANGSHRVQETAQNALDIVSDQLYASDTHFLLELIQNADDNEYDPSVTPSLKVRYKPGQLRIHCNERGFRYDDVEAICRIGKSTKIARHGLRGYIGEKGIGFNSVFKVAAKVRIASGPYRFYFDKSLPLGMIAPCWDDDTAPEDSGGTTMVLELAADYDAEGLVRDLKALDPRVLLFLRRLSSVNVVCRDNATVTKVRLHRQHGIVNGEPAVNLKRNDQTLRYVVSEHTVRDLPEEPKRPGVLETHIILAFPIIEDDGEANVPTESVYAFLPIRDYGFKFLIQADFLLSASRDDILANAWNTRLINECGSAFVAAATLKHQGYMIRKWPLYLPSSTGAIFESLRFFPARRRIFKELEECPTVLNLAGELRKPSDIWIIPSAYREGRERAGLPLLMSNSTRSRCIWAKYSVECEKAFKALGAKEIQSSTFVDDFIDFVSNEPETFRSQPSSWHGRISMELAAILNTAPSRSTGTSRTTDVTVTVHGSLWTRILPSSPEHCSANSAWTASVYSWSTQMQCSKQVDLPSTVALGCRNQHIDTVRSLPQVQIIQQIIFLFSIDWTLPVGQHVYLVTAAGLVRPSPTVYATTSKSGIATQYFNDIQLGNLSLSHAYEEEISRLNLDKAQFQHWLVTNIGVAEFTRIFTFWMDISGNSLVDISAEFLAMVVKNPSWPALLKEHWEYYCQYLDFDMFSRRPEIPSLKLGLSQLRDKHKHLLEQLGALQVMCLDGTCSPLDPVYLPLPAMLEDGHGIMSLLQTTEPQDPNWERLKCIGLGTTIDAEFYLRVLAAWKEGEESGIQIPNLQLRVVDLVGQIQLLSTGKSLLIMDAFKRGALFRIESEQANRGTWIYPSSCVWDGPSSLEDKAEDKVILKNHFPSAAHLCCNILQIKNATLSDLFCDTVLYTNANANVSTANLQDVWWEIETTLEKSGKTTVDEIKGPTKAYSVPLYSHESASATETSPAPPTPIIIVGAESTVPWFIADSQDFYSSFVGLVHLLAFSVKVVSRLPYTLKALDLDGRRLSKCAQALPCKGLEIDLDKKMTSRVQRRLPFIQKLLTSSITDEEKSEMMEKLSRVKFYKARDLLSKCSVSLPDGSTIHGRPSKRNVILLRQETTTKVYVDSKYLQRSRTAPDLARQLSDAFSISESQRYLFSTVLLESVGTVKEGFEHSGIHDLDYATIDCTESDQEAEPAGASAPRVPVPRARTTQSQAARRVVVNEPTLTPTPTASVAASEVGRLRILGFVGSPSAVTSARRSTGARPPPPDDTDLQLRAQRTVSNYLSTVLRDSYQPTRHWTHRRRSREGYPDFQGSDATNAAFTVHDTDDILTAAMMQDVDDTEWRQWVPTWHFEVAATRDGPLAPFYLSNGQVDRFRRFSLLSRPGDAEDSPIDIVVLVRVFDMHLDRPGVDFFKDPWSWFVEERLVIQADSVYKCHLSQQE